NCPWRSPVPAPMGSTAKVSCSFQLSKLPFECCARCVQLMSICEGLCPRGQNLYVGQSAATFEGREWPLLGCHVGGTRRHAAKCLPFHPQCHRVRGRLGRSGDERPIPDVDFNDIRSITQA